MGLLSAFKALMTSQTPQAQTIRSLYMTDHRFVPGVTILAQKRAQKPWNFSGRVKPSRYDGAALREIRKTHDLPKPMRGRVA